MAACFAVVLANAAWRALGRRDEVAAERDQIRTERDDMRVERDEARANAVPRWPDVGVIRDQRIYLTDFVRDRQPIIDRRMFLGCTIVGPANIVLTDNCTLDYCEWFAPLKSIVTAVPDDKPPFGVIAFRHCIFKKCSFEQIAVMERASTADELRRQLTENVR